MIVPNQARTAALVRLVWLPSRTAYRGTTPPAAWQLRLRRPRNRHTPRLLASPTSHAGRQVIWCLELIPEHTDMPVTEPKLTKDRDEIILKFKELIDKANSSLPTFSRRGRAMGLAPATCTSTRSDLDQPFDSARVSGQHVRSGIRTNASHGAFSIKGVLEAAQNDYLQGFMADQKLLISRLRNSFAADLLVPGLSKGYCSITNYKDAAAECNLASSSATGCREARDEAQ